MIVTSRLKPISFTVWRPGEGTIPVSDLAGVAAHVAAAHREGEECKAKARMTLTRDRHLRDDEVREVAALAAAELADG
jgi:hypothetical protein